MGVFRTTFLEKLGHNPTEFSGEDAVDLAAAITSLTFFPLLMLFFIVKKSLWGIRGMAILGFIRAISAGGLPIIPLVITVLAFVGGTTRYCKN